MEKNTAGESVSCERQPLSSMSFDELRPQYILRVNGDNTSATTRYKEDVFHFLRRLRAVHLTYINAKMVRAC
jgi:hypothetical protein